jgi:hypothetical protein
MTGEATPWYPARCTDGSSDRLSPASTFSLLHRQVGTLASQVLQTSVDAVGVRLEVEATGSGGGVVHGRRRSLPAMSRGKEASRGAGGEV